MFHPYFTILICDSYDVENTQNVQSFIINYGGCRTRKQQNDYKVLGVNGLFMCYVLLLFTAHNINKNIYV